MADAQAFAMTPPDRSYTAVIWFRWNDGGVHRTRFEHPRGDCVARAIAIATGLPYMKVHRELYRRQRAYVREVFERQHGRPPSCHEVGRGDLRKHEQPRTGALSGAYRPWLEELGWRFTRATHEKHEEPEHGPRLGVDPLPDGPLIVELWSHACAVVDGVLHDIHTLAVGQIVTGYHQPPPHDNGDRND